VLNYRSYPKNKTGYPFFWTTLYTVSGWTLNPTHSLTVSLVELNKEYKVNIMRFKLGLAFIYFIILHTTILCKSSIDCCFIQDVLRVKPRVMVKCCYADIHHQSTLFWQCVVPRLHTQYSPSIVIYNNILCSLNGLQMKHRSTLMPTSLGISSLAYTCEMVLTG